MKDLLEKRAARGSAEPDRGRDSADEMEILVAKGAGFCFGVKRAVDMAFRIAEEEKEGVYTFGPIIHNPQVIERLCSKGVMPTEKVDDSAISTLIIRTHGVSSGLMEQASQSGFKLVDATCPFVKRAQHYAKLLRDEGYQVVILGDENHPEVVGLMSYAGDDCLVTDGRGTLPVFGKKVGIIVQTTQAVEKLKALVSSVLEKSREVKVFNTICDSTARRLQEAEEMAGKVDMMIVVGGRNSANTMRLADLCTSLQTKTYHIETASELREEWFSGVRRVGITAGASTPDWIIQDVTEKIKDRGGASCHGTEKQ